MLTPDQSARIAAARQEAVAAGTQIRTLQLPGGLVAVTDYDPSDGQRVTMTINQAGQYLA